MRFDCGPGWFSVNGCRAETEEGEVYHIQIREDGSNKIIVRKRKHPGDPLYTISRDERWDLD